MPRPNTLDFNIIKKPHSKTDWTEDNLSDLIKCGADPLYFIRTFMRIQHPMKGALPFEPYPCQVRMIEGMHDHRFSIVMSARQIGKCSTFQSIITKDQNATQIGKLLAYSLKDRAVNLLEKCLFFLTKR